MGGSDPPADFSDDILASFNLTAAEFQTSSSDACGEKRVRFERPCGRGMMSRTNGISCGTPLWLEDPDLSSPAQAFTATKPGLIKKKTGCQEALSLF